MTLSSGNKKAALSASVFGSTWPPRPETTSRNLVSKVFFIEAIVQRRRRETPAALQHILTEKRCSDLRKNARQKNLAASAFVSHRLFRGHSNGIVSPGWNTPDLRWITEG